MNGPLRNLFTFSLAAAAPVVPALAQDYSVMTGQGAVLDSMNTGVAERANREAGRAAPEHDAAGERTGTASAGRSQSAELARMCAVARTKLSRMTPAQAAVFKRHC